MIQRLRDPEAPLPPPRSLGLTPDPAAWAAHLEGPLAELEAALRRVHRDRRARETTLIAKHEAIRRFDRTQSAVVGLLAALYRLAELDVLEERLRPKRGRPRSRSVEAARVPAEGDEMASRAAEGGPPDRRQPLRAVADEACERARAARRGGRRPRRRRRVPGRRGRRPGRRRRVPGHRGALAARRFRRVDPGGSRGGRLFRRVDPGGSREERLFRRAGPGG